MLRHGHFRLALGFRQAPHSRYSNSRVLELLISHGPSAFVQVYPCVVWWGDLICFEFNALDPSLRCLTPLMCHSMICAFINPLVISAVLILIVKSCVYPGRCGSTRWQLWLLDSTGISHQVRGVPDWNHQACANDLSLYVSSTEDANTLLSIVSTFQEWIGLKKSIQKFLAKGALYGKGKTQRKPDASTEARKRKALVKTQPPRRSCRKLGTLKTYILTPLTICTRRMRR